MSRSKTKVTRIAGLAAAAVLALVPLSGGRANDLEATDAGANRRVAQLFNRPPSNVPGGADNPDVSEDPQIQHAQDATGLVVRVDRLESQIRGLNGQLEQLQFQQRHLEELLRKMQQDADFRFQELQGHSGQPTTARQPAPKKTDVTDPSQPPYGAAYPTGQANADPTASAAVGGRAIAAAPTTGAIKHGDAFDPTAQPNAPGVPRQLGRLAGPPGGPPAAEPPPITNETIVLADKPANAPMELSRPSAGRPPRTVAMASPIQTDALPGGAPAAAPVATGATAVASLPSVGTREEFDAAVALFKQGQYESAQNGFRGFVQRNPKDRLVPDATYYLGETYFQRGRHREAAEQYLKLSTDYPKATRAPDGLLRLGMSLDALGAKEQACATFQEVGRKYPTASPSVRNTADREFKRAKC